MYITVSITDLTTMFISTMNSWKVLDFYSFCNLVYFTHHSLPYTHLTAYTLIQSNVDLINFY